MLDTTLEERVCSHLRLVNSKQKCEFLAFFPQRGTTQKDLANEGIFSTNRAMVYFYLKRYAGFIRKQEKADNEGYKFMWLTPEGEDLQKVAQFMLMANDEMNSSLDTNVDYFNLFFEKGSPKNMVRIITAIYGDNVTAQSELYRMKRDKNTEKMVNRLESLGLITTHMGYRGSAKRRVIEKTKAGEMYYNGLLVPVLDFFRESYKSEGHRLVLDVVSKWENYVQRNSEPTDF